MGWKTSMVIVNNKSLFSNKEILNELGYTELKKIGTTTLEDAIYPTAGELFIGRYKNNIIICEDDLAYKALFEELSNEEFLLNELIKKNTEICALVLHSSNNIYGYSISKNGKRVRVKVGSSDDGVITDYGIPLSEETELLNSIIVIEEKGELKEKRNLDVFSHDQLGEELVFKLTKRYFGKQLDMADDDLFNLKMTNYKFKKVEIQTPEEREKENNYKWIIFLIGITGLLAYHFIFKK